MKIVSIPDLRWGRCDIKTVQLLYPSLGKMEAKSRGADDAWMVRDGVVTEGTSNNAFIVTKSAPSSHGRLSQHDPARHYPRCADDLFGGQRHSGSKSANSPLRRPGRRQRPSSPRPRSSSARWSRSTASSCRAASPARSRSVCARPISRKASSAPSEAGRLAGMQEPDRDDPVLCGSQTDLMAPPSQRIIDPLM
jgi:hypothetical protein